MITNRNRVAVAVTSVAIALSSLTFTPAYSGTASAPQLTRSDATDFSSRRRHYYRRGNPAPAAAIVGIIGAAGAIAAERHYRHRHYRDGYGYGGGRCPYGGVYDWAPGTGGGCY